MNDADIFTKRWAIPMSKIGQDETDEEYVECSLTPVFAKNKKQSHAIKFEKSGYNSKLLITEHFKFLIFTGYAKEIK